MAENKVKTRERPWGVYDIIDTWDMSIVYMLSNVDEDVSDPISMGLRDPIHFIEYNC